MNRILIIGSGGAGKSTLALKMFDILHIQVINLDSYYWQPNWIAQPKEKWSKIVTDLCKIPSWIMDGNYFNSLPLRLQYADTVIFIKKSRYECLFNAYKRMFTKRVDPIQGCPEKVDWGFVKWIWNYQKDITPKIMAILNEHPKFELHILKNNKEIEAFIKKISDKN